MSLPLLLDVFGSGASLDRFEGPEPTSLCAFLFAICKLAGLRAVLCSADLQKQKEEIRCNRTQGINPKLGVKRNLRKALMKQPSEIRESTIAKTFKLFPS